MSPVTPTAPDPARPPQAPACGDSAPPESAIVRKLFQLHHVMMRLGDRLAEPLGLTSSRWIVLCSVGGRETPPTVAELSDDMMLSPQNIARMVCAMEREGLVERFNDPAGGRAARLRLTPEGEAARQKTFELRERFLAPFVEGFDAIRQDRFEHDVDDLIANLARFEHQLNREQQ